MRIEARNYFQLIAALSRRRAELGITLATLDEIAGLSERHCSKIFGPTPTKFCGPVTLGCLLGALGLRIIITDDPAALARVERRLRARQLRHAVTSKRPAVAAGESKLVAAT
jgi:hypothetical protein